ncbi:MAG: Aspartate-tRNA ligase, partial [Parcubacteria group bacterium GW2011_GWB1_40_14]
MERILIAQTLENKGKKVKVSGWVHVRRDHGKIIFIDLRDRSGLLQVVFAPSKIEDGAVVYENAKKLRSEWVVSIEGTVNERPANSQNTELPTGSIELFAEGLEILSESQTPPFDISDERVMNEVSEELTMKYKYLDLRRVKRTRNLTLRHRITKIVRDFLDNEG